MMTKDIQLTELKKSKKKAIDTVDILEHGFTTEKIIHKGYEEYENAKKRYEKNLSKFKLKQCFGKWQYIFKKGNKKISLIKLRLPISPFDDKEKWFWEIYAYEDKSLFTDTKRFPTMLQAVNEVKKLLQD